MKRTIVGSFVLLGVFCSIALGQYSGGRGLIDDPFLISRADDLFELAGNLQHWGRPSSSEYYYFRLTTDINLSGSKYRNLQIGTDPANFPFAGIFDGNYKTISGYWYEILKPSTYGGLFGCVAGGVDRDFNFYQGIIKNLTLKDVHIKGVMGGNAAVAVGGLVGQLAGLIENCDVSGSVEGGWNVGGLVGETVGLSAIKRSHSEAVVKGTNVVGGLVGYNATMITEECSATGTVTGSNMYVGGFVGKAIYSGIISKCFASGDVTGGTAVGGFVGEFDGDIENCYARGIVKAGMAIGGFVGQLVGGQCKNCYSTGKVVSSISPPYPSIGGFSGSGSGITTFSFWDTETSNQARSPAGLGLPTAEMQRKKTYTDAGWDFNTIWKIDPNDYPTFIWQKTGPSTYKVSGYIKSAFAPNGGIQGVSITSNNGGGSAVTNSAGFYELIVPAEWSGRITPSKTKYQFTPSYRDYTSVTANSSVQNYTGKRLLAALKIISPNGGETCFSGTPYPVSWDSKGEDSSEQIRLEYSDNNGATWNEIIVTDNVSPYPWATPYLNSNQYLVRVSWDERPDISDKSDTSFTVYFCNTVLRGDLNDDCYVNMEDLKLLVSSWMNSGNLPLDLDGDSHVNQNEFALLASSWLKCGNPFDPACEGGLADFEPIPQGSNQIGEDSSDGYPSERPARNITLDAFRMDAYEITNRQYAFFLNASLQQKQIEVLDGIVYRADSGSDHPYYYTVQAYFGSLISFDGSLFIILSKDGRNMANDPVGSVTWYGAVAYCNWRSQMERKDPCYDLSTWACDFTKNGYRLPTEAEWEYSARGGLSGNRFPWGETISHNQANYYSWSYYGYDLSLTSCYHPLWNNGSVPFTSPVGSFSPNGFGLHDMVGNVSEWCNDWFATWYYSESPVNNPTGPLLSSSRVVRGGGWNTLADYCRISCRDEITPGSCGDGMGVRVVLPK